MKANISDADAASAVTLTSTGKLSLGVLLTFVCLVTILCNVMVIVAITSSKKLRKVNAYYLISLAVADLCVGCFVMPPYIAYQIAGEWLLGETAWIVWRTFDFVYCSASVFNICALSIDRYNAVAHPIKSLRTRTRGRCLVTIAVMWVLCCVVLSVMMVLWKHFIGLDEAAPVNVTNQKTGIFTIVVDVFTFYIPLVTMLTIYWRISKVLARLRFRRRNTVVRRFSVSRLPRRSNSCPTSQMFPRSMRAKSFMESLGLKIKTSNSFDLTKTDMYRRSRRRSSLDTIVGRPGSCLPRSNTSSTTCSSVPSMETRSTRKWSTNVRLQSFKCILPTSLSSESGLDNLLANLKPSDDQCFSMADMSTRLSHSDADISILNSLQSTHAEQTHTVFADVHLRDSVVQEQRTNMVISVNAVAPCEVAESAAPGNKADGERRQKRRRISRQDLQVSDLDVSSDERLFFAKHAHAREREKTSASEVALDLKEPTYDDGKSDHEERRSKLSQCQTDSGLRNKTPYQADEILREVIRELSIDGSDRTDSEVDAGNDHRGAEDGAASTMPDFSYGNESPRDPLYKTDRLLSPRLNKFLKKKSALDFDETSFAMSDFTVRQIYGKRRAVSPCQNRRQSLVVTSVEQTRRGSLGVSSLLEREPSPNISGKRRWSLAVSPTCRRNIRRVSQCPGMYSPGGTPPPSPTGRRRKSLVLGVGGESDGTAPSRSPKGDLRKASIIRDMLLKDTNRDLIELAVRTETTKETFESKMRRSHNTISDFKNLCDIDQMPMERDVGKRDSEAEIPDLRTRGAATRTDVFDYVRQIRQRKRKIESTQDRKATRVLTMIVGCFIICWLPYKITYILLVFLPSSLPHGLIIALHWLLYTNSMLNPIIYVFANQEYRRAVMELVCFKRGTPT